MKMREIIIDCFAGGGGTSLGIEMAGLNVDIAINHDEDAIIMHRVNHPGTRHFCENIWKIDPVTATKGRPVAVAWFSPDCTHFSKAKGGRPVKKQIRGLAWVVIRWAAAVRPRVIILENVEEFRTWGPLTKENKPSVAGKGRTFNLWVNRLRGLGYAIEWRELVAADYGTPTLRKRLFIIARCDGGAIVWPEKTHGPGLLPYRAAAECIDWSIPCPSIFERKRPLAENTLRRIARGIRKFVIEAKEPFIVRTGHYSNITGKGSTFRGQGVDKPLGTICSINDKALVVPVITKIGQTGSNGGRISSPREPLRTIVGKAEDCLVAAHLTKYHGLKGKETRGQKPGKPISTLDTSNRHGLVTAFLSKYYTCDNPCGSVDKPMPTITSIDHNAVVTSHLTKFYGTNTGSDMRKPVPTVTATGTHIGEVRAFLIKYYNTNTGQSLRRPLHTITTKHRLGLVTVAGQEYQIADIGLRMLTPRELARAQGFPDSYILTGTKKNQVAKIGNSVCPPVAAAIVKANVKLQEIKVKATGNL